MRRGRRDPKGAPRPEERYVIDREALLRTILYMLLTAILAIGARVYTRQEDLVAEVKALKERVLFNEKRLDSLAGILTQQLMDRKDPPPHRHDTP